MILLSIAAALACGCYGGNAGEGAQGALTFHEFADFKQGQNMFGGVGVSMIDRSGQLGKGYVLPKMAGKPAYFTLPAFGPNASGNSGEPFVGVMGKSAVGLKSPDLMWIDWNRDKKFEDDERAVLVPDAGMPEADVFKPTVWPKLGGRTVYLVVLSRPGAYVTVMPAGYMEGAVELDGKPLKIGIVDANLNGVYGDVFGERTTGDVLLIDRNGDGKFDPPQMTSTASIFKGEEMPLLTLEPLNGRLYEITVSQDASTVVLKPNTDPMGTLEFRNVKAGSMVVYGPRGMLFVEPVDGKCRLPAASYKIEMLEYKVTDSKGVEWTFGTGSASTKKLEVAADQVTPVKCGPPLSLVLKAESIGGVHVFSLEVKDCGGSSISGPADPKGGRPGVPKMTITDSNGKIVKSLAFSYG